LAADQVRRGFDLLEADRGWYGLPAPLWLARGMLASTQGRWDEAARAFEHAVSINRQYGLPYDEAKVLREYGRMYAARNGEGDPARASVKLEESAKLFEAVGAQRDVERIVARKEG
jgi:tetratricopeptide (TPR) repeat protein